MANENRTFDLKAAAAFLCMSPSSLRAKAKEGRIPGAKVGKRWVFLEADLVAHLRAQYASSRRAVQVSSSQETETWHYTVEAASGGCASPRQTASEYANLLGLKTR